MEYEKINDYQIKDFEMVTLKEMGNISEICYIKKRNNKITTQLIDKDHYFNIATGEVFDCKHITNRSDNKFQVGQSLKRLRDLINTNVTNPKKCKWITLTYRENMRDTKKLYIDFKYFIDRLRYKYSSYKIEYIVACEPQGRGAWHMHLILIFDKIAPFINNMELEKIWGYGYTSTKALDDVDNIGAYLTAYLGDMELTTQNVDNLLELGANVSKMPVKTLEINNNSSEHLKKSYLKGARLCFYPPNFNLYRISRGIKQPIKQFMSYKQAKEKVGSLQPTFTTALLLSDTSNSFNNTIAYEHYNKKRK